MADTIKLPGVGPVKKTYVYIGVGITAGILLWAYYRRANAAAEPVADVPATVDAGVTDYAQESDASGYNVVYPPSTGAYAQYGYDIYGNPLPAPTGLGGGTITSNSDWADEAAALLTNAGVEQSVATTAVTRVLGGLAVTSAQRDYFMQAVGALGQPPQGYPTPIRLTDNGQEPGGGGPSTGTPGAQLPAPANLHVDKVSRTYVIVDWNDVPGAKSYNLYQNGQLRYSGHPLYSLASFSGLKPATKYSLSVRAVGSDGATGPAATISATTSK